VSGAAEQQAQELEQLKAALENHAGVHLCDVLFGLAAGVRPSVAVYCVLDGGHCWCVAIAQVAW
jgi:hypothetical protein